MNGDGEITMIHVIGLGDNVVDYYVHSNTVYPGGNALNFAVYVNMLGYKSAYMGSFGDDENALHVYRTLKELGIPVEHCRFYVGENGCAPVNIIEGDRIFLGSNKGGVTKKHPIELTALDIDYLSQFDLIHTSIFSYIDPQLQKLSSAGLRVSYDFSNQFDETRHRELCPHLWCACLSSSERSYEENCELINQIVKFGCPNVVLTRGTDGAMVYLNGKLYEQSPYLVAATDTMGAGDSFITAFLTSYLDMDRYCRDFPIQKGGAGLLRQDDAREVAVRISMHKAAVFAASTCQQDGSFGYGHKKG